MSSSSPSLIPLLHPLLQSLIDNPYPTLPNPPNLQKRASVALIVRLSPSYSHWPPSPAEEKPTDLPTFLSQPWTQHATPELLFIKRSARVGDRWTSHIALPGGKLDPSDPSDCHAAIRETSEEVGIDLEKHAIPCGNLPQRLVTTHWGKKPLLVLCPFVFLLTSHDIPPLKLQPTEVASVHWVPLPSLRNPERRTTVLEDVSSRLANQETGVKKWMLATILGKMVFAGIALEPSESLHSRIGMEDGVVCNRYVASTPSSSYMKSLVTRISSSSSTTTTPRVETPLLLWGLTLGVISDFLDLLPPKGEALELWTYPTFTPLDVRFVIWLMTYRFKLRKRVELQSGAEFRDKEEGRGASFGVAGESVRQTKGMDGSLESQDRADETGLHGLGSAGLKRGGGKGSKAAVTTMLEGWVAFFLGKVLPSCADRGRYYELVRRAVLVALVGRAGMGVLLGTLVWRAVRRRGLMRGGVGGIVGVSG